MDILIHNAEVLAYFYISYFLDIDIIFFISFKFVAPRDIMTFLKYFKEYSISS